MPVFPLHGWLADTFSEAPVAMAMVVAGKLGLYSMLRFHMGLFPAQARAVAPGLSRLAVIGILYGACLALVQRDFWRLLAYAVIGHFSFITLGVLRFHVTGWAGAVYQILNQGVIEAAIFLLLGALEVRYGTSQIAITADWPPGFRDRNVLRHRHSGHDRPAAAERLRRRVPDPFQHLHRRQPQLGRRRTIGVILGAAYMLWLVQRVFYGGRAAGDQKPGCTISSSANWRFSLLLVILMLVMGVAPMRWLKTIRTGRASSADTVATKLLPPVDTAIHFSRGGPAVTRSDIYRILPEVILTLTGVAGHADRRDAGPRIPAPSARLGSRHRDHAGALVEPLAAFSTNGNWIFGTVETSPFTIFFHVLICGIVLVALLLTLDTLPEDSHHQGEYYALIVFGAVGMCLLTGAVELLVVFIALEISSISTYVLAGYRKQTGRGPEAAIKYFLLGSFATAFLLYGIALIFGATGTTQIYEMRASRFRHAEPRLGPRRARH